MNNRNKHFKSMSDNTKETHTTLLMQVHALRNMFSLSLCVQADSDGGERSELFAFEGCASQRTEAQGGCGRCCSHPTHYHAWTRGQRSPRDFSKLSTCR